MGCFICGAETTNDDGLCSRCGIESSLLEEFGFDDDGAAGDEAIEQSVLEVISILTSEDSWPGEEYYDKELRALLARRE